MPVTALPIRLLVRQRVSNRECGPTGSRGRNPLMSAEWEAAFEVVLNWEGVGPHEPGAVGVLCAEQKCYAFAITVVGGANSRKV